jgi:5'(3')-deoxyribonucleotidase
MKKKIVLVDMDDTATWLLPVWVKHLNQKHNLNVDWHDIKEWDMTLAFPTLSREQIYEPLATEEIWDEVTPREGAVEALTWLHECGIYEIFICTSTDYRNIKPKYEKVISKYFPFIDWKHFIVISRKQMVKADYIIDDAPHNLVGGCQKHRILISMPHNENFNLGDTGIERADTWANARFLVHYNSIIDRTNESGYLQLKEQIRLNCC